MDELEKSAVDQPMPIKEVASEEVVNQEAVSEPTTGNEAENAAGTIPSFNPHGMDKGQLVATLSQIVEDKKVKDHKEVAAIKTAFYILRNKEIDEQLAEFVDNGNEPSAFAAMPDADENRLKELLAAFRDMRSEYLAEEEKRLQNNLDEKNAIIVKIQAIVEDIDNVNLRYNEFQQLTQDFKNIKDVPPSAEADLWKNYQKAVEQFYDHLKMNKELRDLAFKKNLEAKKALIEEARALDNVKDVVEASRKLHDIHLRWKDLGPVSKELRDEIWDEFKAVSAVTNKRHQDFFLARKENETQNEENKTKLCEEVEALELDNLKSYNDWDAATKKVQELQAQWKSIGFASRKVNNQLFQRFRAACDHFFEVKAEFFKKIKAEHTENLAKKVELCEKAEALRDSDASFGKKAEGARQLQEEWRKVGNVARKNSDAVWARFSGACNAIFDQRRQASSATRKEENANLAAKKSVIARIKELSKDMEKKELLAAIKALQEEWQQIGHVPFKLKDELYKEYRAECDAVYNSLDVKDHRQRMSNFAGQLEDMKGDGNKISSERDRLLRVLDKKKAELQTVENNLGFFNVKSSAGNSMVQEITRRAARIKDDIKEIEDKIKCLNNL